ncbi:MAG: hypothetical protein AAB906_00835, partial [Patescibacteria group bacterium]
MQKNNKKNILNISVDEYSSSFIIDLKGKIEQEEIVIANRFGNRAENFFNQCRNKLLEMLGSTRNALRSIKNRVYFFIGFWRVFYRLCFSLGWGSVFLLRFIYFFITRLASPAFFLLKLSGFFKEKICL